MLQKNNNCGILLSLRKRNKVSKLKNLHIQKINSLYGELAERSKAAVLEKTTGISLLTPHICLSRF